MRAPLLCTCAPHYTAHVHNSQTCVLAAADYNVQSVEVRSCGEFRAGFDLHSPSLTPVSRAFPLNFQSQERYEKKQKGTRQGILHKSRWRDPFLWQCCMVDPVIFLLHPCFTLLHFTLLGWKIEGAMDQRWAKDADGGRRLIMILENSSGL